MAGPVPDDFSGLDIREEAGGSSCLLKVRVAPRSSRNAVQGVAGGALRLRIQAPPVDGAANEAACDFLAEAFGLTRASVHLEKGHGARDKLFRIQGMSAAAVRTALGALPAGR